MAHKYLYIKTYGCQMNVYDSTRMADLLAPHGYALTEAPEGADMVILNTCHIREKAAEKVFSELGRLKPLKMARQSAGGEMLLAVAGCVAQAEGAEIMKRAPYVDIVLGPQTYHRLPEMIAQAQRALSIDGRSRVVETDFPVEVKFDHLPEAETVSEAAALVAVQEGCDKFCTFCVVPYTRGAEYSRPVVDIVAEVKNLVSAGAKEITLLGQNVNAYHGASPQGKGEWGLGALIQHLSEIPGLERMRYTTSHPRDMDDALIEAHRDIPQLMPFLHLPVQSGSARILTAMNRQHTPEHYHEILAKVRAARPDIAISSDFIIGFPGETEADFEATKEMIRQARFAQAYSFKYSPRPGTPASLYDHQVPEIVKDVRLQEVQEIIAQGQTAFNEACIGKILPVLFERTGRQEGIFTGRSPYLQTVQVRDITGVPLLGAIRNVLIQSADQHALKGVLVADHPPLKMAS